MINAPFIAVVNGFAVAIALIVAVGPQNALVLRLGLKRLYAGRVATVCFVSIGSLIVAGVAGAATLFSLNPMIEKVILWFSIIFIIGYGVWSFRSAWRGTALTETGEVPTDQTTSAQTAVLTALAFCWLNPHAYLDTLVLIGGISTQYVDVLTRASFGAGAIAATGVWFYGLAYGASRIAPVFEDPKAWRVLDVAIGLIMWSIAAGLVIGAI